MKVSVTLHSEDPGQDGNQRQKEVAYCGFNRQYAELKIDPDTGNGTCEIRAMSFPQVQADPETIRAWSLGVCHAPEGYGGAIIIADAFKQEFRPEVGMFPTINFVMAGVFSAKLQRLGLIRQDDAGRWVELTEKELRGLPPTRSIN